MKWIGAGLGTIFDPVAGKVFLRMMGLYPAGSIVELSNGALAVVQRPSEQFVDRPVVRVVRDGRLEEVFDLAAETSLSITNGMDSEDAGIDVTALLAEQPPAA